MKHAIVTIVNGDYFEQMAALTHPTIRAYAERIGAEFIVWRDVSRYQYPEYKKMEIGDLLGTYDRVLYIDTDVIVRPDAPDIFDVVPADHLGILEESKYFDRQTTTVQFMTKVGYDARDWNGKYYNAGIYVCSRCHRELFVMPPREFDHFRDQSWFNTLIADRKVKVFPLPHRFNRIVSLDRIFGEERLDAWFLHYAGFHVEGERAGVLDLIARDLDSWRQTAPHYRYPNNVAFIVQGSLAEQIAAEPVIRYAKDVIYRGDNLTLVSAWPAVFGHLDLPIFRAFNEDASAPKFHARYTREHPEARHKPLFHQVHPTTLAAITALGLELPAAARTPKLAVHPATRATLAEIVPARNLESLVLVHPGGGLPANSFPPDVWQSYADALVERGYEVAVIGNRGGDDWGIVNFDRSRVIDLVDRLSLAELVALVSQARVLVSNDSAPVQIAGAFDNWIGVIATLRLAEYVLPWRKASQHYRAASLERAVLAADYFHKPSGSIQPALDACDEARLRECLPEPRTIVEFADRAFAEK
jgi:hypothetical protein